MNIKTFVKSKKGILCVSILSLLLAVAVCFGIYGIWRANQPRFHDLTVELGTDSISIGQFTTEFADPKKSSFVTDLGTIDISKLGTTEITLRCANHEETVLLTVEDTTPPTVKFFLRLTKPAGYKPDPNDFIESVTDLSATTVSFKQPVEIPDDYGEIPVEVVVEDEGGNRVEQECVLSIAWMRSELTLELGEELTKAGILFKPEQDGEFIDQAEIDAVNNGGIGEYIVHGKKAGDEHTCKITVSDTKPPVLKLQPVRAYIGTSVTIDDFVESATDYSGTVELRFVTEPSTLSLGSQNIEIEAVDANGNKIVEKTTLTVITDEDPPQINGMTDLTVEKYGSPNYMSGVSAWDAFDGNCSVTYDASSVNTAVAGVYYVDYQSTDSSGNTGYARRQITVLHDFADTTAMVKRISSQLGSDPEALRDYVRDTIWYSHSWGGDDPIWYGFQNQNGNCYVHALCLNALLKEKGYTTQLIYTTDQTHYWLIINLNGVWRHIDPTPSSIHGRYSLMTDAQRYETLSGRNWDRSAWPACE